MRNVELSTIKSRIAGIARQSPIGDRVADIVLETEEDDESGAFLRVQIEFKTMKGMADSDLLDLIRSIEDSVLDVDDRYPSVRFSEAA